MEIKKLKIYFNDNLNENEFIEITFYEIKEGIILIDSENFIENFIKKNIFLIYLEKKIKGNPAIKFFLKKILDYFPKK